MGYERGLIRSSVFKKKTCQIRETTVLDSIAWLGLLSLDYLGEWSEFSDWADTHTLHQSGTFKTLNKESEPSVTTAG